ncbi:MAG TPA: hypothetical protein VMW56_20845 [Candidatus Margulisiibacteriota bacterium]|nr:hypothetical protein [Candidatus Margulisiibacteriota bacterium]
MKREAWQPPLGLHIVIAWLWISTGLNLLYWLIFFTSGALRISQDAVYAGFEAAFPAADAWLAVASIACAEGLRRRRSWAVLYGIAAGSAFVYLGLMDTLYNLEHAAYLHLTNEMIPEIVINVTCFVFGPFLMWYVWRQRRWLGA